MDGLIAFLMTSPVLLWVVKSTMIVLTGCMVAGFMKKGTPAVRYGVWLTVFLALAILPIAHWWLPGWKLTVPVKDMVTSVPELNDDATVYAGNTPDAGTIQFAWIADTSAFQEAHHTTTGENQTEMRVTFQTIRLDHSAMPVGGFVGSAGGNGSSAWTGLRDKLPEL